MLPTAQKAEARGQLGYQRHCPKIRGLAGGPAIRVAATKPGVWTDIQGPLHGSRRGQLF